MAEPDSVQPYVVLILSGKRKAGKDYIANRLLRKFGEEIATIIHLSGPLKSEYARLFSLDYDRLLSADTYKETYREDMIAWGEQKRRDDPGYFCRLATASPWVVGKKVWIICDARRQSDLQYFAAYPHVIRIRVRADDATRTKRGFEFIAGIDDAESECGLDAVTDWDYVLDNSDGKDKDIDTEIDKLISYVDEQADSVGDADIP
ncbi:phosphomevalonate kinase-like [Paramacrobiotus metropolitanus]|uniref:phosphomevalonate kinase-like n=1 Tax=Paramacrobiotus metropolitanus TaxID=2943436 RepID=UPI002445625B|nr:phosphomevalonate kinase-like [Paramacrobiotus metropolitanus]